MAVLALDLGTSAAKVLVLADDGRVAAITQAPYTVDRPREGWAEADPLAWRTAVSGAARRAIAAAGDEPVRAIGLAGQMHGVVVCDGDGRPLRPALLWPDRRAVGMLDRWRALPADRRAALANPVAPGMAGPLLAWLAEEEPQVLDDAALALQPKDWLRWWLTGEAATEPTDASATLLWDIPGDRWATDIATAVGVDPELLAPVIGTGDVAGALTAVAATALGAPRGTPVYAGAADTAAALVGSGVRSAGQRLLNLGTGAQLVTIVDRPDAAPEPTTHRYRAAEGGWYAMAAVQNAGLALGWARDAFGLDWAKLGTEAFERPPSAHDPVFIPHISGERTPLLDPDARGAWIGLALEHGRGDLVRAVYEGVAHGIRHAREALEAEGGAGEGPLLMLGGGSVQPEYRQLLADVFDEELELVDDPHATALGAALIAGGTAQEPPPRGVVMPDPAVRTLREERYARWASAVDLLRRA